MTTIESPLTAIPDVGTAIELVPQVAVAARLPAGASAAAARTSAGGTGLLLPMWRTLGAREVVAVEPSAAMRAQAAARCVDRALAEADAGR